MSAKIHPTALVSSDAELADDVEVGPYAIIEGKVRLGAGCVIKAHAYLIGPLTMGVGNVVFSSAVIGERPQHFQYKDEPTGVEIGDHNVFREHVTVHRGTVHSWTTKIGSRNYLMVNSHVAHDCVVGNRCLLANGALLGGHCTLDDNVYISGNSALHQFVRVGRLALLSGCSASTKDVPPFIIQQGINIVEGINVVGMRRAGMDNEQIQNVKRAFRILYRERHTLPAAMALLDKELGNAPEVAEMLTFIRTSTRGINSSLDRHAA